MDSGQAAEEIRKELEELRRRVAELEASEEAHERDGEVSEGSAYFRKLAENAYDAILVLSREGVMLYVSPSVKRITGFEPGEMLGKNAFDLIHPDDRTGIMQKLAAGIALPGFTEQVEYRSLHKDGSWFIAEAVMKNLLDDSSVQGIVFNLRDITAFREMEQELRKSEERYRFLIENLNDVIFTIDNEGSITYISPAIERISKYKVGEMLDQAFTKFVYPKDVPDLLESFRRTMNGVLEPHEFRLVDKDGRLFFVQTSSRPFQEEGRTAGLIGMLSEITERIQADEARKRSEESFRAMIRKNIHYYRGSS